MRARLVFAGLEIEFVDRDRAIRQIEELARRGTHHPIVIYGLRAVERRLCLDKRRRFSRSLAIALSTSIPWLRRSPGS